MIAMIAVLLLLMFLGLPVSFSMLISTLVFMLGEGNMALLETLPQRIVMGTGSFVFLAIPFFILAGELMNKGGITKRLIGLALALVSDMRGGLGYVVVITNMIMASVSGSSHACAAAIGTVTVPMMVEKGGYDLNFAAAVNAASATIGPIIPPSIGMVIYASTVGVSVGDLFMAGAIPGVLMGFAFMLVVYIVSIKRKYPRGEKSTLSLVVKNFINAIWSMIMPIIILGGILSGIVTPTEAAAAASFYGLIVGLFVYRELKFDMLPRIFCDCARSAAQIMFIIASAGAFGWLLTYIKAPAKTLVLLNSMTSEGWVFLIFVNILLLILGCFMEGTSIMLLLMPLLGPACNAYGIDLVHFGIVFMLNVMVGQLTPPVGLLLFVMTGVAKISITDIVSEVWPFIIALTITLIIITYIPAISLWLPGVL